SFIFTSSECSKIKHCKTCGTITNNYNKEECDNPMQKCTKECGKKCSKTECKSMCGSKEWVDAVVVEGNGEKELLKNFCNFIAITDPDMFTGYNTWGFDDIYLWKRLILHNIDIDSLTRINNMETKLIKKELTSNAYGNNEFNYLFVPGRETFDMLIEVRREYKLVA